MLSPVNNKIKRYLKLLLFLVYLVIVVRIRIFLEIFPLINTRDSNALKNALFGCHVQKLYGF
jgi:hypothetical protein